LVIACISSGEPLGVPFILNKNKKSFILFRF
jgi:hypothetical protein